MGQAYLWVLSAHLIGIVAWVGGLFAALVAASVGSSSSSGERALPAVALMRRMAHPGAALAILAGLLLIGLNHAWMMAGWLHAKLALVVILIVIDLMVTFGLRRAAHDAAHPFQPAAYRGAVALLFLLIVLLATLKPF